MTGNVGKPNPSLHRPWSVTWAIARRGDACSATAGCTHPCRANRASRALHLRQPRRRAIRTLAARVDRPLLYLKVCAPADAVRPCSRPTGRSQRRVTVTAPWQRCSPRHASGRLHLSASRRDGAVTLPPLPAPPGEEAARGRIVAMDDLVVLGKPHPHRRSAPTSRSRHSGHAYAGGGSRRAQHRRRNAPPRPAERFTPRRSAGRCTATPPTASLSP